MITPPAPSTSSKNTSGHVFAIIGFFGLLALVWLIAMESSKPALYRVVRPSATVAGEMVVEWHQTPPAPQTNAYGLVTNDPDPLQNKINDVLTRCLEVSGTPKHDPTHKVTKQELLITTTCLDIAMGLHNTSR